jgi:putative SOS response-associated peptidase YedK
MPATLNARAESVGDKPTFRDAFKRYRCIVPASGYYEWIARPDGKQPDLSAPDGGALSFAGLWDRWKNPETGEFVTSCTIIVTAGNTLTQAIHDCVPVILDKTDLGPGSTARRAQNLLKPPPRRSPSHVAVSMRVNSYWTGDDDPTLISRGAA